MATRIYERRRRRRRKLTLYKTWGVLKAICKSLYFIRILKSPVKHLDSFVVVSDEFVPST
jgi:hypothetical protein